MTDFVSVERDIVVVTTLDAGLQRRAETLVQAAVDAETDIGQAAAVVMTPDGAVRAMVGGRSYYDSQYNRATQALRQPGSAFKPVVYLAGLEAGLRPHDEMIDEPVSIGAWSPKNFDDAYAGVMRLDEALARSVNTIAVKTAQHAGWGNVAKTARRLGISGTIDPNPSLALGSAEVSLIDMTAAYAVFANGGYGAWPYAITEIRDRNGTVLYTRHGGGPGRIVNADDAADMNRMLALAVTEGTGRKAALDRPAAGKTGTSQNHRDGWFVGYTGELVAGVWMGNDDASPAGLLTGGGAPAALWRSVMNEAHAGRPVVALFDAPSREPVFADQRGAGQRNDQRNDVSRQARRDNELDGNLLGWLADLIGKGG